MPITMTKEEALEIQRQQVEWYNRDGSRPWLAAEVAKRTTADALESGIQYPASKINEHIPRGADIEFLIAQRTEEESCS